MDQKYNVGDKVLIVNRPVECVFGWVTSMDQYCGEEATIKEHRWSTSHHAHLYKIDVDNERYSWCENCFSERTYRFEVDVSQVALELFAGV